MSQVNINEQAEKPHLAWAIRSETFSSHEFAQGHETLALLNQPEVSVSDPNPEIQEELPRSIPESKATGKNYEFYRSYSSMKYVPFERPPLPYRVGWKFTAFTYDPCDPDPSETRRSTKVPRLERNNVSPLARCRQNPPVPGRRVQNHYILNLKVRGELQVSENEHAQVFIVSLCGLTETECNIYYEEGELSRRLFVAKVYDPLYGDDQRGHLNLNALMDIHFAQEAATYKKLKHLQGHDIPEYYGSYSICLSSRPGLYRHVRMILIEYIASPPMSVLDPKKFSQSARQQILRSIIEIESRVFEKDIEIGSNLKPQNILVIGSEDKGFQVVLIDLEGTQFRSGLDGEDPNGIILGQYISPLIRWFDEVYRFGEWVDWAWKTWLEDEFAYTRDTITPEICAEYGWTRSDYTKIGLGPSQVKS